MIKLVDGPAEGAYAVKRAPLYLRAVRNTDTGAKDVLDQLDDTPGDAEEISVYKLEGKPGVVHLNFGSGSGKRTGFYATGDYHHVSDADGAAVRDTMEWHRWVAAQVPGKVDLDTGVMA